jgi:hypothetical protein
MFRYTLHRPAPSLGALLAGMAPALSPEQLDLAQQALRELAAGEKRPTFLDAHGLLRPGRRPSTAAEPGRPAGVE